MGRTTSGYLLELHNSGFYICIWILGGCECYKCRLCWLIFLFCRLRISHSNFSINIIQQSSLLPFVQADGTEYYLYSPFYFSVLSVIFFFSAFVSVCNYLGIISFIVKKIGVTLALMMVSSWDLLACYALCVSNITDSCLMQWCRVHLLLVSCHKWGVSVSSYSCSSSHTFISFNLNIQRHSTVLLICSWIKAKHH